MYSWNARILFGDSTRGKAATGIQLVKPGMLKISNKKELPSKNVISAEAEKSHSKLTLHKRRLAMSIKNGNF